MPRRAWIVLAGAIVLSLAVALLVTLNRPLRSATGVVSHTLCSGAFVSGLPADRVYAETLKPIGGVAELEWALRYEVAKDRREVRTTFAGVFGSRAVFIEGLGCILVHGNEPASVPAPVRPVPGGQVATPLLKEIAGNSVVEPADALLRAALERTFVEPDKAPYR